MKKNEPRLKLSKAGRSFIKFFLSWNVFIVLLFLATGTFAQGTKAITGTVTDQSGQALPGVTVVEEGTTNGTITNSDGIYSITVNPNATLTFSFVGMKPQTLEVGIQSQINVQLEEETIGLDEVVAIGYGSQSRRTLTTAISKVGTEGLEDVPVSSLSTALQGKMSGVRVYQSDGGMPGSNSTIRIRGGSSINRSNSPLVIIDGLPRTLDDININDVESVEVFKDASSTAIYGARASNGVVYITTKKGKGGNAEINFNATVGVASPWKYMDLVSGEDYLRLTREALARSPKSNLLWGTGRGAGVGNDENSPWSTRYLLDGESVPEGYKSMIDPVDPSKTIVFQDNDFQKIALRDALEQSYYLSANGGSEKILYSAGIGYDNQEGISIGTKWERFSGRMNVDFKLRDNLKLNTNVNHTTGNTNSWPSQHAMFSRSLWMTPTARVYMDDGSLGPGLNATYTNPLWYNDVHKNDSYSYKTQFGASMVWDIITGLTAKINADYMRSSSTMEHFYKANVYSSARPTTFDYTLTKTKQFEGVLTYIKSFNKHNLNVVVGGSEITYDNLAAIAEAEGGSTDKIQTLNAAPTKTEAYTYRSEEVLLGFFGRLTYDYNKKYMASFSIRRDASSRFAENNRVGYFPGVSLGWMVSEEQFLKNNSLVNSLKLRSSYGQTGNNSVGLFDAWGQYSVGYNYALEAGTFPTAMPNFDLGWETTNQFDIGTDLGLFENDKILISADYYNKTTHDLLFESPLPNTSGFNSILTNIGSVKYYGFDIDIQVNALEQESLSWNVGLNISYNKNKVKSLPDNGMPQNRIGGVYDPITDTGVGGIAEGEPLGQIYGFVADFIIDNWEQANSTL
ncbi:MAG: SusC/RagA family TonB-linked outer membrane protein [Draconibacterium sp.]